MTEGNISSWRVQEGSSYSPGDVLLEIETDKATMDVEAQDDGVLMKIMQPDGTKGVQVGQRIAVMAEAGDDLSSLEIPQEDTAARPGESQKDKASPQDQTAGSMDKTENSSSAAKAPLSTRPQASTAAEDHSTTKGEARTQIYPLYPSVEHLLHENGLSDQDIDKIPASGPSGRLLKGDVLAYLGHINRDYPAKSSARINKLQHLDLSNIQLAERAAKPEAPKAKKSDETELPKAMEIAIPISLSAVIATQKRVQDSLGIFLPLSTFIARASELANEDLPPSKSRKPTADDLFNAVLGLNQVPKASRGHYVPQVTGLSSASSFAPIRSLKKPDIIDILAPHQVAKKTPRRKPDTVGITTGKNIFSVVAETGDEGRASEYLERVKLALEKEPGRLVL